MNQVIGPKENNTPPHLLEDITGEERNRLDDALREICRRAVLPG